MHVFILLTVICVFPFISVAVGKCPDFWKPFRHNCYKLVAQYKTWFNARKYCESLNAHLAVITDQEQQQFIQGLQNALWNERLWIGLYYSRKERSWQWADGSELSGYTNWDKGEPNNANLNENCVDTFLYRSGIGKWNDFPCWESIPSVCQKHI